MDFVLQITYYGEMKRLSLLSRDTNRLTLYGIGGIIILAMAACLAIGLRQSVWFDEAYSLLLAKQAPAEIIRLTGLDTHPPLYYLLLHYWGEFFQWNVAALRLLSVLGYGGALVGIGLLVRRLFGARAALWAVGGAALSPLLMRYGFELRMYSIASCIGVFATLSMVAAREAQGRRALWLWIGYAFLVAIGVYTVYYLVLLWVAHVVWLVWMHARSGERGWYRKWFSWPWLWAFAGSVLLFLPWLPTFVKQMGNGALAPIGQPMNAENFFGIVSFNSLYQPLWQLSATMSVIYGALLVSIGVMAAKGYRKLTRREKPHFWLLVAYIGVPIALLVVISTVKSMYVERYLSHVAIGLMAAIGVLASVALRQRTRTVILAVGVIVFSGVLGIIHLASVGNYNFQRMQHPQVGRVAALTQCDERSVIVAADPYVMIELMAYKDSTCAMRFYSEWDSLSGGYAPLNHSPLQLKSTDIPALADTIYYVHYDEAKLATPSGYTGNSQTIEGLTVTKLQRN